MVLRAGFNLWTLPFELVHLLEPFLLFSLSPRDHTLSLFFIVASLLISDMAMTNGDAIALLPTERGEVSHKLQ